MIFHYFSTLVKSSSSLSDKTSLPLKGSVAVVKLLDRGDSPPFKSDLAILILTKPIGNRFLGYAGVISQLDLPNRVQLVAELEHFVGRPPPNPVKARMSSQVGGRGDPQ